MVKKRLGAQMLCLIVLMTTAKQQMMAEEIFEEHQTPPKYSINFFLNANSPTSHVIIGYAGTDTDLFSLSLYI